MYPISTTIKLRGLLTLVIAWIFLSGFQCGSSSGGGTTGWKVYVKTSPCSGGRAEWITVAQQNPTGSGGSNYYFTADTIAGGFSCTKEGDNSCTFASASDVAEKIRASNKFADYCCREYSVWKHYQTGKMSVVLGKFGKAGDGWDLVKGDLCCEEAEALAGIPGACSGSRHGGTAWRHEENIDRPGGDYKNFELSSPSIETCQKACEDDPNCKAFGYVRPGFQGPKAKCWLKNTVPQPMPSNCCVSGIRETSTAPGGGPPIGRRGNGGGDDGTYNDNRGQTIPDDRTYPSSTPTPAPPSGRWTLVSVTVTPETPDSRSGWSYGGADSTSATLAIYQGDRHNFQWTRPPQQIDDNGFTMTGQVSCQSVAGCATLMNIGGSGISSDTPQNQWVAEANGRNGSGGRGEKTIIFRPSPNASELEVEIGLMWGAVKFKYKYRRM